MVTKRIVDLPSSHPASVARAAVGLAIVLGGLMLGDAARGQSPWDVGDHVTDGDVPPFVFVTMPKTNFGFGTDAKEDSSLYPELDLGGADRRLWFMDSNRAEPVQLFPLSAHVGTMNLPGTLTDLQNGAVHEPTVYHYSRPNETDRYWVIFSFAIDVTSTGRHIDKPCDLFAIDVTSAIASPASLTPATAGNLPIVRLTDSTPVGANYQEREADVFARSFNPDLAPQVDWLRGVAWPSGMAGRFETNTGACVVDEEHGPVLYFASNERRTDGQGMMAADVLFDNGVMSLANRREVFHFGTTSLTSFFESPRGAMGSYRSSTESLGVWGIFEFRSDEAEWQTVSGYGNGFNFGDHNGTTIAIGDDPQDSLIAISRYYIGNNESFGQIILLPYDEIGQNYDFGTGNLGQKGAFANDQRSLFSDVPEFQDLPQTPASIGKFAHPAGSYRATGQHSATLYLTYSEAASHGSNPADYDAKLVVVTDLSAPIAAINSSYLPDPVANPNFPVELVLSHDTLHCFTMKPIMQHTERFGWKHRRLLPLLGKVDQQSLPAHLVDMPVAQVIAGPIERTDVLPTGQRVGDYDPTTVDRNNSVQNTMFARVACLTKDLTTVSRADVWGLRVFVTDQKVRQLMAISHGFKPMLPTTNQYSAYWGYLHHDGAGGGEFGAPIHFERFRHLSDVAMDPSDGTVNFALPANVPVKFFLLHQDGSVLASHRNHHSFAPGQLEQRCAGCHDHVSTPTALATTTLPPFDTLTQTGRWERTAAGPMAFNTYSDDAMDVYDFKTDIFPLMRNECSECHEPSQHPGGLTLDGTAGFDMDGPWDVQWTEGGNPQSATVEKEVAIWASLSRRRIINRREGAAMSPFAWYFYGVDHDGDTRLDGKTNQQYKPQYVGGNSTYWITTDHNGVNPHARSPGAGSYTVSDRSAVGKVIEWIDSGAGITHNAVDYLGNPDSRRGLNGDSYPIAISAKLTAFRSASLVVGYWDTHENIDTVSVIVGATTLTHMPSGNGKHTFDLSALTLDEDTNVVIEAVDSAANRSRIQRTMRQLWLESETNRGAVSMTVNGPAFKGGDTMQFQISAPQFAAEPYFFLLSEDVYPGWDVSSQNFGLYLLGNYDTWMSQSLAQGLFGPLDDNGQAVHLVNVPLGMPHTELYGMAVVMPNGKDAAKSNFEAVVIE